MSDKKRSAKRKLKNALIAAALTASVILALPAWSVGPAKAEVPTGPSEELILKQDGNIEDSRLTINRAGENPAKQGTITVDLYKVADAVKDQKYDGYTLAVPEGNTFTSVGTLVSTANDMRDANLTDAKKETYYNQYMVLAEQVAKEVLKTTGDSTVSGDSVSGNDVAGSGLLVESRDITGTASAQFTRELEAGLYLVIAHGKDLTPAEYIGTTTDGKRVTMAYNNGYVYSYQPMLIALPMRGTDVTNVFSTAQNAGNWQYTVTADLKAEETVARVPLQITKTFTGAGNALLSGKNGCIFRIEAELNGQRVYSNVVAAEFTKGTQTVTLAEAAMIPAGATVTVIEENDGAAFTGEAGENVSVTKTAAEIRDGDRVTGYQVSFTNTYNGSNAGGDIVTNSFTKQTGGSYGWNNPRPSVSGNDVSAND